MPYKSDKQRRYMNWAAEKGKISKKVVNEFNKESKGIDLPEKAPSTKGQRYTKLMREKHESY